MTKKKSDTSKLASFKSAFANTQKSLLENLAFRTLGFYDYGVAGVSAIFCLGVYFFTLTPSISAGDNGELTVGAHFLGVAHSPAYPIHSLFAKLVTFLPVKNIAWRVNFFSALSTAVFLFFSTLVFIKILHAQHFSKTANYMASATTTIALGLSEIVWGQSTIAEVYTPSSVFYPIITLILLNWHQQLHLRSPLHAKSIKRDGSSSVKNTAIYTGERFVLAIGLVFGFALGGHHTILMVQFFIAFYFLLGWVLYSVPRVDFRREITGVFQFLGILIAYALAWMIYYTYIIDLDSNLFSSNYAPLKTGLTIFIAINAILTAYLIFSLLREKMNNSPFLLSRKISQISIKAFLMFYLGFSIYVYVAIRSHANPPINWGGISESPDFMGKVAKFFNTVHRKQFINRDFLYSWNNIVESFKIAISPIHSMQFSYPLWVITGIGFVTMFFRSPLFFIIITLGVATYNIQLTMFLRIKQEIAIIPQINIFYIFSIFLLSTFLASGLCFIFNGIHSVNKKLGKKNE